MALPAFSTMGQLGYGYAAKLSNCGGSISYWVSARLKSIVHLSGLNLYSKRLGTSQSLTICLSSVSSATNSIVQTCLSRGEMSLTVMEWPLL